MPEGNTIHRLARLQTRDFAGRRVNVSSPQGRFAAEASLLNGRRLRAAEAFGKHLFHHYDGGLIVHVHLGMAGWFYRFTGSPPPPRSTVRMRITTRASTTDLIGPPTCELISPQKRREVLARLGPDPLRRDFDPAAVWDMLMRRPRRSIGDVLLDQRVLAGVGNIYRNESLFLAGIYPLRAAGKVTALEWDSLWRTIRRLMRLGVARSEVSTVDRAESPHPASQRAPADDSFYVYQAKTCRRCGGAVRDFPLSGRRMFACPRCQPRRRKH